VEPLRVEVTRGDVVEAVHRVHAVAVRDGEIVASAGDPELVAHMRSSAKPLQALPLVRSREDLDDREIAIASASHLALPEQLAAVESLLARAGATADDLECGPEGTPPSRLKHNCSGKHAGMLAACAANGWPRAGYRLPEHPMQQACSAVVAEATGIAADTIPTGTDGCGVVSFGLPLRAMAHAFSRFAALDGAPRVVAAMRAHPQLIRGPGAPDTRLMQSLDGWIAKGGAEGLLCAAGGDGLGIALKAEDGSGGYRAIPPALAAFLRQLGHDLPDDFWTRPVENSRHETVGAIALQDSKIRLPLPHPGV
jgi:L-asparaginase II